MVKRRQVMKGQKELPYEGRNVGAEHSFKEVSLPVICKRTESGRKHVQKTRTEEEERPDQVGGQENSRPLGCFQPTIPLI